MNQFESRPLPMQLPVQVIINGCVGLGSTDCLALVGIVGPPDLVPRLSLAGGTAGKGMKMERSVEIELSDELVEALKKVADRNGRTLEEQIVYVLESAGWNQEGGQ